MSRQIHAVRVKNGTPLFVAAVTRDVTARVDLARRLPGESVLLLFPDQATAARTLGQDAPSVGWVEPSGMSITYGGLLIDPLRQDVTWNGIPLQLTKLERAVLARLAEPPLQAWSYERLYRAVWGSAWLGDTSALHATIKRLRRKLRAADVTVFLESVRGVGFRLAPESAAADAAAAPAGAPLPGPAGHAGLEPATA